MAMNLIAIDERPDPFDEHEVFDMETAFRQRVDRPPRLV
jgi:hypothetical protein